jgi:hypothetical protein
MKAAQHFERLRHCLRIQIAVAKDSFTKTSDFPVLVQSDQASAPQFGDTQAY